MPKLDSSALARWRFARRASLGAIVIAGTMATAAAVAQRVVYHPCGGDHELVNSYYTYSGIGVELTRDGDSFVVSRVFPNTPADGQIHPGATLLSVDGEHPEDMRDWTRAIRGKRGSDVVLEVAYPCSSRETVVLQRDVVRIRY
jgi:hypothetical protein